MHKLLYLDTETTGVDTLDRLCQVAYKHSTTVVDELFKPPVSISAVASSVTHITDKHVALKHPFIGSMTQADLLSMTDSHILVAHNASFDLKMLEKEDVVFKSHICTMKVARHIDDGTMVNHQLQYLRYYYGLDIDLGELSPHDALADIIVLEAVFKMLANTLRTFHGLDKEQTIAMMVDISSRPSLLKNINFGKYRGKSIADVAKEDKGYLIWLLNEKKKNPDGEEDWIYTLSKYIS